MVYPHIKYDWQTKTPTWTQKDFRWVARQYVVHWAEAIIPASLSIWNPYPEMLEVNLFPSTYLMTMNVPNLPNLQIPHLSQTWMLCPFPQCLEMFGVYR